MFIKHNITWLLSAIILIQKGTNGQAHVTDNDQLTNEIQGWRNLISDDVYNYYVNKQNSRDLRESDIVEHPNSSDASLSHIQLFSAVVDRHRKWGNGIIPYEIGHVTPAQKTVISKALEDMQRKTCVQFIQRTDQQSYVRFINGGGCSSNVGRLGGLQLINLGLGCSSKIGEVQHEVMHAIGFYHEQSRSDRDQHVRIIWNNILPTLESEFRTYRSDHHDLPYDYESVMHYGWNYFAIDPSLPTILPVGGRKISLGTRDVMSRGDVEKINRLYDCPQSASQIPTSRTTASANGDVKVNNDASKMSSNFEKNVRTQARMFWDKKKEALSVS